MPRKWHLEKLIQKSSFVATSINAVLFEVFEFIKKKGETGSLIFWQPV